MRAQILVALLVVQVGCLSNTFADSPKTPRVAFFGFQFINTSLEPTSPAEAERVRMLDDMLQQKLNASGRFRIISLSPELRAKVAAGPEISNCNGANANLRKKPAQIGLPGEPYRK